MKLLHWDGRTGTAKLLTHTMDDLWHLYNLVSPGNLVHASTHRRGEEKSDKLRAERADKKRMWLGIRVEKVEFHEFSDRLRISGTIEEGPQDIGQHHTLNLEPGDDIELTREWRAIDQQRVRDAEKATHQPLVTFIALDDEEAVFAVVRQYGVQEIARIKSNKAGKDYPSAKGQKEAYFMEILDKLAGMHGSDALIIIGPGFEKEELSSYAREKRPELVKGAQVLGTGQTGMRAVSEVMKGNKAGDIVSGGRVAMETSLVEELMARMGKDGAVAYGPAEVKSAIESGAAETLLITDELVREKGSEELMRLAESTACRVVVISTVHEGGKELSSLGGAGALLRYKLSGS
ncbi:MAG: mRNA surveillance protein pelota [Methanobacteriota archaeon]